MVCLAQVYGKCTNHKNYLYDITLLIRYLQFFLVYNNCIKKTYLNIYYKQSESKLMAKFWEMSLFCSFCEFELNYLMDL